MKAVWVTMVAVAAFWALVAGVVSVLGERAAPTDAPWLAVFAPGTTGDAALARLAAAGVRPLRPVIGGGVWLIRVDDADGPRRVRDAGAWAVTAPLPGVLPMGCGALIGVPRRALPETLGR